MQPEVAGEKLPSLRELRATRGLTLDALHVLAGPDGPDQGTISRIERGVVKARPETVVRLARALGISASRMAKIVNRIHAEAREEEARA